jgi:hypothetical protein
MTTVPCGEIVQGLAPAVEVHRDKHPRPSTPLTTVRISARTNDTVSKVIARDPRTVAFCPWTDTKLGPAVLRYYPAASYL